MQVMQVMQEQPPADRCGLPQGHFLQGAQAHHILRAGNNWQAANGRPWNTHIRDYITDLIPDDLRDNGYLSPSSCLCTCEASVTESVNALK